jgi:hypothetical protein
MNIADTARFATVAPSKVAGAAATMEPRTGVSVPRIRCHPQRLTARQAKGMMFAGRRLCALLQHPGRYSHDIFQRDDAAPHRPYPAWATSLPVLSHVNCPGSMLAQQWLGSSPNAREKAAKQ